MSRLEKIVKTLSQLEDGVLLAVFHYVIRECLKRNSVSVEYLSKYPIDISKEMIAKES